MNETFYSFIACVFKTISFLFHPVRVEGLENVPETGKLIVCANHRSFQDPFLLASYIKQRKLFFMAKKELFKYRIVAFFLKNLGAFPVARGENDLAAIRASFKILNEGKALGIFPEGHRYASGELHAAQNGISLIALRSGAPVLPAYIDGNYRPFKKITLKIGKPIDLSDLGGKCDAATIEKATRRISDSLISLYEQAK